MNFPSNFWTYVEFRKSVIQRDEEYITTYRKLYTLITKLLCL
jgi:hypothetical protein